MTEGARGLLELLSERNGNCPVPPLALDSGVPVDSGRRGPAWTEVVHFRTICTHVGGASGRNREMRVDLKAKVRTRDGEEAGDIRYAVFNPDINDVSHFVVGTGGLFGRDVVVSADAIAPPEIAEDTSYREEVVVLNLSKAELEGMPEFDQSRYSAPPPDWASPADYGYPTSSYMWPNRHAPEPAPLHGEPVTASEEKSQLATISKGTPVLDRNGDDVGVVEDLHFGTMNSDLNVITVRIGGPLNTLVGGGETVEVPREMIASVTSGGVHLQTTKEELRHMARPGKRGG